MQLNPHYAELNESYLFSTIAHKVADYQKAHPEADVIRLGIGDVTLPLAASVTEAMHKAVEEQGHKGTFHGYIPSEQGYEFLRDAIRRYYAGHGVELDMSEIFISDGAKSDLGNLLDLFSQDNTILVPDPVYPVYVDDNVMAGRKILYLPATAENGFLPMPDEAPTRTSSTSAAPTTPPARPTPSSSSRPGSPGRRPMTRSSCLTPPTSASSPSRVSPAASLRSRARRRLPSRCAASPRSQASPARAAATPSCRRRWLAAS